MKTATLPPVRVAPDVRQAMEQVLEPGETLSQFVESAVRAQVDRRAQRADFVRRGLAAIAQTREVGGGVPADDMIARLEAKFADARRRRNARPA